MTRQEKLLMGLDVDRATLIEIGALDKPFIPRTSPGAFFVDRLDTESLRERYRGAPGVNLDNLVHVSGVWGEQSLAEIAASVAPVDGLIASHVIEHVPDLVTWLQEISAVLKPAGEVRLIIPDRRYTFDLLRTETVLADVLAAHLAKTRIPQVRQVIDHIANAVVVDTRSVWDGTSDPAALVRYHEPSDIERVARDVRDNQTYHDVHCWTFTPASFAQLMMRLAELDYHSFKCVKLFETEPYENEFIVIAQRSTDKADVVASWRVTRDALTPSRDEEIERWRAYGARQKAAFDEVTRSKSWRLTAPLRAVRTAVRGLRSRAPRSRSPH